MRNLPLIFVVDDDVLTQKLIESELKAMKTDVMCFSYGEEALKALHLQPDLIILDYIFVKKDEKVLSGHEILQEIRTENPVVPVIFLSGQDSGSAVLELIKLGIEEYIVKEKFFLTRLKEAVSGVLGK